jgi:hypothetical protein
MKSKSLVILAVVLFVFIVLIAQLFPRPVQYPLNMQPEKAAYYDNGSFIIELRNIGDTLWIENSSSFNLHDWITNGTCTNVTFPRDRYQQYQYTLDRGEILTLYAMCPINEEGYSFDMLIQIEYSNYKSNRHQILHKEIGNLRGAIQKAGTPMESCGDGCKWVYNFNPTL